MKTVIRKGLAVLLSAVIAFTMPVIALAQHDGMSLVISSKCYAGVTYYVDAEITGLSGAEVIGDSDTMTAFSWRTDSDLAPISTTNNYKIVETSQGVYTVSESAKITFPEEVGEFTITASYGDIEQKSISVKTLQPITSVSVEPESNDTDNYYYEAVPENPYDTLYMNAYDKSKTYNAVLNYTVTPEVNDDKITLGLGNATYTKLALNESKINVTFSDSKAPDEDIMTILAESGYKFSKKIKVVKCTALTGYNLKVSGQNVAEASANFESGIAGNINNFIVGDSLTIDVGDRKPSNANDTVKFILYNPDGTLAPASSYTVDTSGKCTINPTDPGTYTLKSFAVSKGGYLSRNMGAVLKITYSEANPITDIKLYNIENGEFDKNSPLEQVTLYTSSKKTYDLSQNVSALPIGHSHGVIYSSRDTSIATVDEKGIITAKSRGTVTIDVASEKNSNIKTSCVVKVVNELSEIRRIDSEVKEIPQGHSIQLVAVTNPAVSDESIRWSSSRTDVLTIDEKTGYATANPDFDMEGLSKIDVLITATSDSNKTQSDYITIVPSISATSVTPVVTSDNVTVDENNVYSTFTTKTFILSADAVNDKKEKSNDIFTWCVSYNNETQIDLDAAKSKGYFTYTYDKINDTYNITATKSGVFEFYCYAHKRGEFFANSTVYGSLTMNVYDRATNIGLINCQTTLPTASSAEFMVSMSPFTAYDNDPVIFESSDESIVRVEKLASDKAILFTGDIQGSATVTYKSTSGSVSKTVRITVTNNINFAECTGGVESAVEYKGSAYTPEPELTYNGMQLVKGRDYQLSYSNNTNVGVATITVKGINEFNTSTKLLHFTIEPKEMTPDTVLFSAKEKYVTITDDNPAPLATPDVKDIALGNRSLKAGTDFTYTAYNNTESGTATLVVTGCGNYTGEVRTGYNVCDNIAKAKLPTFSDKKYTGSPITPSFKVTYNGRTLTKDIDYSVQYSYNVNVGTATVTIKGIAPNFTGSQSTTFKIIPKSVSGFKCSSRNASSVTLSWSEDNVTAYQIYDVNAKKVVKTIKDKRTTSYKIGSLSAGKAYQYKIRSYVTINGTNYYSAYSSVLYTYTAPKAPSISLKTGSKYVTASWGKVSGVSGYEIQYSTRSDFKGAKTTKLSSGTASKKFTKLTKGKTYYVRVRSYKKMTINSKSVTAYSSWSKKSIKCK